MNGKVSDAAARLERAYTAGMDEEFRDDLRVVLDALPKPAKPEAVRLRDDLRERAEFEAWAKSLGWKDGDFIRGTLGHLTADDYPNSYLDALWNGWQAALAATGKQQVGETESVDDDWHLRGYAYASKQATTCAGCDKHKHTPLRIDAMGGYVCLTCIDQKLSALLNEFGYQGEQVGEVQGGALASLPLYRMADDADGKRGLHRDDTGSWVKIQDVERALAARQPVAQEPRADLVPGIVRCAKCAFQLARTNLYMYSGTVGAGDSKTEPCPNGCGPLWPVTWETWAREGWAEAERLHMEKAAAPPAQAVDLRQLRVQVAELLRSEFDLEVADPEDHRHDDGQGEAERLAARIAALIDGQAVQS